MVITVHQVDHYSTSAEELEWFVAGHVSRTRILPISGSRFSARVKMHVIGEGMLWTTDYAHGAEVLPYDPPDAFLVHLSSHNAVEFTSPSQVNGSTPDKGFVEEARRTTRIYHAPGNLATGISLPRSMITQCLVSVLDRGIREDLIFTPNFEQNSRFGGTLNTMVKAISSGLEDGGALCQAPIAAHHMFQALVHMVLGNLTHNYSDLMVSPAPSVSPKHVKAAIDYIDEHAGEPLTIPQIAEAVNVSVRALQMGFRRFKDTTVRAYIREVRLHGVRRELLNPESGRTVGDIARSWGFIHLGHFAASYLSTFGENPSMHRAR
ncbi:AraC family transcriptional regulator [Asticcacaulis sp. SL142]|uniref:AraC family transcriptional regulator n=1 Tax=Asticcacaulis sp. SL142 TaxID=2995155 RepID=UPI00226C81B5|nr:AraC family transcriptional regulator [Asticcacaulis sp. SL142]WAC48252.1 AraC family transcriptional regulator [Asticcacaulis sp. SL142]